MAVHEVTPWPACPGPADGGVRGGRRTRRQSLHPRGPVRAAGSGGVRGGHSTPDRGECALRARVGPEDGAGVGGRILIYPVRPGDKNETLRCSLRSVAAHLPDATVVLAGHRPRWVTGVEHIPVSQRRPGRENVARILRAVCTHPDTPPEWVLMNDDFFAMQPQPPVPLVHRETLAELSVTWRGAWYAKALANTRDILRARGHEDPLSYD